MSLTRIIKRHLKRAIIILIVIMLLAQVPVMKKLLARGTAALYTTAKYPGQTITFDHLEYEPHFGNYIISYTTTTPKKDMLHLTLMPKMLPIFITYDSWDQPISD